jgi:hypothetical protein
MADAVIETQKMYQGLYDQRPQAEEGVLRRKAA